ncbi:MAG: helix-turn-helix transcriptional regulator [Flavobacteriaceae bacterium]|nr:helix-turn-helix transcriptional regulator [Flavobacteriaceae bacterium]
MQTNLLFELEFAKAYPAFTSNLSKVAPNLTSKEIKISMYLRLNYDSKQIQSQLEISHSTYFNACSSIRKKLKLKRNENLTNKLLAL